MVITKDGSIKIVNSMTPGAGFRLSVCLSACLSVLLFFLAESGEEVRSLYIYIFYIHFKVRIVLYDCICYSLHIYFCLYASSQGRIQDLVLWGKKFGKVI